MKLKQFVFTVLRVQYILLFYLQFATDQMLYSVQIMVSRVCRV